VGGVIFIAGLIYSWRQGYVGFQGHGLRNLLLLVGGLALYMVLQGTMQYADMTYRPAQPYQGEGIKEGAKGTPLDYGVMVFYFMIILFIGTWFGRKQKTSKDFFFGGQRFSWWLIAFSLVATTIGSYSFVKYSKVAYQYGLSSSQTYFNDWFWVPLFIFGWLPIVYFSRIVSIPEYFERRFNRSVRMWATALILVYLIGYVGVNLFTMGKALNILLDWPIFYAAVGVATISAIYVTAGGQTSVIMTDLFQGVMLLATGLLILWLGADYLGGFDGLWENLPRGHRQAFANFNTDPGFNGVGIFWQDAMANTAVFYFLNQGIMMRFMAARSVNEGRKAAVVVPLVLMPVAAAVVASGGWVGKALSNAGVLPADMEPARVFFIASEFLCSTPGLFGLIMASLTAALMSTVDTLITAVAAIVVNDIYKPYIKPAATDKDLLGVARITSVGVTIFGIALVPVFMQFDSIYAAHGAFTAAITPPLVVTLLCSVFWRRFSAKAAVWTLAGGITAVIFSIIVPEVIAPFAHGIPMAEAGDGVFAGAKQYKYIRAFYGLSVSTAIALITTFLTKPESEEKMRGLVWGTINAALAHYKGSPGKERDSTKDYAQAQQGLDDESPQGSAALTPVALSAGLATSLSAQAGDLVYVSDRRWWLGGLRSGQGIVVEVREGVTDKQVFLGQSFFADLVGAGRETEPLLVERLY
jgi:SSS family solute:Na+ symporter